MTRAHVTDRGLSRRLGQKVVVTTHQGGEERTGRLVYFPNKYALRTREEVIPIQHGDSIGLQRGRGCATFDAGYIHYTYIGN